MRSSGSARESAASSLAGAVPPKVVQSGTEPPVGPTTSAVPDLAQGLKQGQQRNSETQKSQPQNIETGTLAYAPALQIVREGGSGYSSMLCSSSPVYFKTPGPNTGLILSLRDAREDRGHFSTPPAGSDYIN